MVPFIATYKPRKAIGYDAEKAETVMVIAICPANSQGDQDRAAIIRADASLDIVTIDCLTDCIWPCMRWVEG